MVATVELIGFTLFCQEPETQKEEEKKEEKKEEKEKQQDPTFIPADGGIQAWLVCFTAFCTNGTLLGIINTFGILGDWLIREKGASKSVAGAIGSAALGGLFFFSLTASVVIDRIGIRKCGLIGAALCSCGCLASSFCTDTVHLLFFTFSFLFGLGAALLYSPSLVILGHYFRLRLGLANGLVTLGNGIVSIALSQLLKPVLLNNLGLSNTFRVYAGISVLLFAYAVTWKEQRPRQKRRTDEEEEGETKQAGCGQFVRRFVNIDVWKNRRFALWAVGCPIAMFGVPVFLMLVPNYLQDLAAQSVSAAPNSTGNATDLIDDVTNSTSTATATSAAADEAASNAALLIMTSNIANSVARILFGKLVDILPRHGARLQMSALISAGLSTVLFPLCRSLAPMIVLSLGFGFGLGGTICLMGPVAFHTVGSSAASQAMGFLFQVVSVPVTAGPLVAGLISDHTGRWDIPFYLTGGVTLFGSALMLLIPSGSKIDRTIVV